MHIFTKAANHFDRILPAWSMLKTQRSLKTLRAHQININLCGVDLSNVTGFHSLYAATKEIKARNIPLAYDTRTLVMRLERIADPMSIEELNYQGIHSVDLSQDYFLTKFWSGPLYESFTHLITKHDADIKQKNLYIEFNNEFFKFASSAPTGLKKDIVIRVLMDLLWKFDHSVVIHSQRTRDYAVAIAKEMGLSEKDIKIIETTCLLHDIGKICYGKDLWNKSGKLSDDDFNKMKMHVIFGLDILKQIKWISEDIIEAIRYHHYYRGYPEGIDPTNPPLWAKIIAVADSFDAATGGRKYQEKKSPEQIFFEMRSANFRTLMATNSGFLKKQVVGYDIPSITALENALQKNASLRP